MTALRRDAALYIFVLAMAIAAPIASYAAAGPDEQAPVVTAPTTEIEAVPIPDEPPSSIYPLTNAERDLIARVCWGEARGEGETGMEAVAQVVYNRLTDGRFGATVSDIATVDQFHGLRCAEEPGPEAYEAVAEVFDRGEGPELGGALYFCTARTDPDRIKTRLTEVARVGNHIFYTD